MLETFRKQIAIRHHSIGRLNAQYVDEASSDDAHCGPEQNVMNKISSLNNQYASRPTAGGHRKISSNNLRFHCHWLTECELNNRLVQKFAPLSLVRMEKWLN